MAIFQSNGKGEIKLNFYIGDLHFGHKNVLEFDHRPYLDVEDMDRNPIKYWNDEVSDDAFLYMMKFEKALNATACINYYAPSSLSELVTHKEEIMKKYMRKNSC